MSSSRWFLLFFPFLFTTSPQGHAEQITCEAGSSEKTQIHKVITSKAAPGSLIDAFQVQKTILTTTNQLVDCLTPETHLQTTQKVAKEIEHHIANVHIKRQCFVAAMKRQHGTDEFFCPTSTAKNRVSLGSPSENGECVSDQLIDYTRFAFNEVISCMSNPQKPIDPLALFALMNNESAFHFYVASRGGVGIGQLTTSAINAVNHPERSGSPNYLQQVLQSKNPHCAPFQQALKTRLKTSYDDNYCPLIQPADGFARALVYSVAYYLMTRDTLMTKVNHFLQRKGEERATFYNFAALAMYGPTALSEEAHVIEAYTESKGHFKNFVSALSSKVPYAAQTIKSAEDIIYSEDTHIRTLNDCLEN